MTLNDLVCCDLDKIKMHGNKSYCTLLCTCGKTVEISNKEMRELVQTEAAHGHPTEGR